jgi:hypothetical protein
MPTDQPKLRVLLSRPRMKTSEENGGIYGHGVQGALSLQALTERVKLRFNV